MTIRVPRILPGIAVFVIAFLYLYWISGDILELFGDEGIYLEGGRRIALGQIPYRDFFVLTGPLTFWIQGALAFGSGMSLSLMRLPMILDTAFLVWAVYWFTSRYTNAIFSIGSAFAFLAYESRLRLLYVNHRWDSAAMSTAAIIFALAASRSGRSRYCVLSGILAAGAAWATPSLIIVAVPLLWWSARRSFRDAAAFLGGGALITAGAGLYLQWNHALTPMIQSLRWTSANYTAPNRVSFGNVWAGTDPHLPLWQYLAFTVASMAPAILPVAAVAGWLWYWRSKENRTDVAEILPLLAAAAALTLAAWPRWSSDTLLHTLSLSWFLCAALLYRLTTNQQRVWWCGAILLVAAVSLGGKMVKPFSYSEGETRVGILRDPGGEGEVLDDLERWVQPGDSLFSFPYFPSAYFFLNARNPSRYTFLQPGMMNQEDEQRAVEELRGSPPKWVIFEKFPAEAVFNIWPGSDPARIPMEAMNRYLAENYRQAGTINSSKSPLIVMERVTPPR